MDERARLYRMRSHGRRGNVDRFYTLLGSLQHNLLARDGRHDLRVQTDEEKPAKKCIDLAEAMIECHLSELHANGAKQGAARTVTFLSIASMACPLASTRPAVMATSCAGFISSMIYFTQLTRSERAMRQRIHREIAHREMLRNQKQNR